MAKKSKKQWSGLYGVREPDFWGARVFALDDPESELPYLLVRRIDTEAEPMRTCLMCGAKSAGKVLDEVDHQLYMTLSCSRCSTRESDREHLLRDLSEAVRERKNAPHN